MQPLQMDLIWRRNAPDAESFTLMGDDGITPVDLSGITLRMQVRLYQGAADPALVTLTSAAEGQPGFFIDDAAGGSFTLTPPASVTLLSLPFSGAAGDDRFSLTFDILIIHGDGIVEPFIEGRVFLPFGVTR